MVESLIASRILFLKIVTFFLLCIFFGVGIYWMKKERMVRNLLFQTIAFLDTSTKKRIEEKRKNTLLWEQSKGILYEIEKQLLYSGITRKWSFITPEVWFCINVLLSVVVYFLGMLLSRNWIVAFSTVGFVQIMIQSFVQFLISYYFNATDADLIKFLDFLGNYSITAGEISSIMNQISLYMGNPLKEVLSDFYYEAQTTGNTGMALIALAEKIEHPKFKELMYNIEISLRYSADFKVLVSQSRRSIKEYMRMRQERKEMIREAWINMLLLAGMSGIVLWSIESLIGISVKDIMFHTFPGNLSIGILLFVLFLFVRQIRKVDR